MLFLLAVSFSDRQRSREAGCSGQKYCPPACASGFCTDAAADECRWVYSFPGMDNLGKAIDVVKYHQYLANRATKGELYQDINVLEKALLSTNLFSTAPDFRLQFDEPVGGVMCHYVRPNATAYPTSISYVAKRSSLSSSLVSSSHSESLHAGFSAHVAFVSVSGSFSQSSSSSSAEFSFSGTASANFQDYELSITPEATFTPGLLDGCGEYDGSPEARLKYENLYKRIGQYFVTSLTTGGSYYYSSTITKTAKSDASAFEGEFEAQVGFVTLSGGGSKGDKSDEYHTHNDLVTVVHGGDNGLIGTLQAYQPMIKDETIDVTNFQKDYGDWAASVPLAPVIVDLKVEHISKRLGVMSRGKRVLTDAQSDTLDNMRMAYDELFHGLSGSKITLLRVQYGMRGDFDKSDAAALFLDLPPDLKSLPYDAATNTGFSTRYDPAHSCPSADLEAKERGLSRTLRYNERCDAETNLLKCDDGQMWCELLTESNMGRQDDKELNAELWMRLTFVAGVGNDFQTIEFKPCGYGATWAIYWNEHAPYAHNRTARATGKAATIVGPRYASVEGGGAAQQLSDADKALFPCAAANKMAGFGDGSDPACCDKLATDEQYMTSQQVGCPDGCDGEGECAFPPVGPLHCENSSPPPPPPGKCADGDNPDDCSALIAFKHATGDKLHWRLDGSESICDWFGITCDSGRVTGIRHISAFQLNVLIGTLPSEISKLSALTKLYLDDNSLSGTIPADIGKLSALQVPRRQQPQRHDPRRHLRFEFASV